MSRSSLLSPALWRGLANLPYGLYGALTLVTMPQLLAADHVAEPTIAGMTAAAMLTLSFGFLAAPILDVRFSRRSYAIAFGLLSALFAVLVLDWTGDLARTGVLMVVGYAMAAMFTSALAGWLGDVTPADDASQLGAGFQLGNSVGFGLGAILFIGLIRGLPGLPGAVAVAGVIAAPLGLLAFVPRSRADRLGIHESFGALARDLRVLAQRRDVWRTALLIGGPAAAFALSNTLTGLGHDFGASEPFVALVAGTGVTLVGIVGSLAAPPLIARWRPMLVYLSVGVAGAALTLMLAVLPRVPFTLALGIAGENGLQSIAFAVASAIIFRGIGEGNPLAATQYATLNAAMCLPVTYMQWVDGQAYGRGGLAGCLLTDAAAALLGVAVLLPFALRWSRGEPADAPAPLIGPEPVLALE